MIDQVVRERLEKSFEGAEITIDFADGKHMAVEIIAGEFAGKSLLEQHGMVNALLADLFEDGSLHAMKLKTKAK